MSQDTGHADHTIMDFVAMVGVTYKSKWRQVRANVTLTKADDERRVYDASLTNTETGVTIQATQETGSFFQGAHDGHPSCMEICSTLATTAEYVFEDGTPDHGLVPFAEFCDSLGFDPQKESSLRSYTDWVAEGTAAATLMGYELRDAARDEDA